VLGVGRVDLVASMGERGFVVRQTNQLCVLPYVCVEPCQSVLQFTDARCVGRARNSDAWGVGKLMQLGCMRGKRLCV